MRKRLFSGIAALGYGKLVGIFNQLALVPLFALAWGLPLYGQWLLLTSIPIFLSASDFGLTAAAGNRIISEVARDETASALTTFQTAWALILGVSVIMLAVLGMGCWLVPGDLLNADGGMETSEARMVLAVMCLYGIVSIQWFLFAAAARSSGKLAQSVVVEGTIQLAETLGVMALVLGGARPLAVALCYLAVRTTGLGAHIVLACKVAPWLKPGFRHASRHRMRELARPALAALALPLAIAGSLQGSAMAVGAAGGAAVVPIFTSLRTLSRLGLQGVLVIMLPLYTEYTMAHAVTNRTRMVRIMNLSLVLISAAGLAFALVIGLFGQQLLDLWTDGKIVAPAAMVGIMAMGIILNMLWMPLSDLLLGINRHEEYTYVYVCAAVLSVVLTYVLVIAMGVTGAALAKLALEAVMLVTVIVSLRRNAMFARAGDNSIWQDLRWAISTRGFR